MAVLVVFVWWQGAAISTRVLDAIRGYTRGHLMVHLVAGSADACTYFPIVIVIFVQFGGDVVHAAWQQQ
jgi:hypothetical protein